MKSIKSESNNIGKSEAIVSTVADDNLYINDTENEPAESLVVLAQEGDKADAQDVMKRGLVLGLGSVISMLFGCAPSSNGERVSTSKATPFQSSSQSSTENNVTTQVTTDEDVVSTQMHMIDCAPMTPPGTVPAPIPATPVAGGGCSPSGPATPPASGSPPVSNPVNTAPVNTVPAPDTTVPALPVQNVVALSQTYLSLGPENISVHVNDMTMMNTQVMSDGVGLSVWGFTDSTGATFNGQNNRLCPGPVIEIIEGQESIISLSSMHPHTLHLHGLDVNTLNDGVPATSGYVSSMPALGGPITAPAGENLGSPFNYIFTAPHAGTYLYHCHVDTVLHMEMGMSGTLIVRPSDGNRSVAWSGGLAFDKEYIWQLHTFDSRWHSGAFSSGLNTQRYTPDYFMINGLDGPDILSDASTAISGNSGQKILIRLVNLGYMPAMVNLDGITFDIESSDGRPLKTIKTNQSELLIGPGERYDIIFTMPTISVSNAAVSYLDIMGRRIIGQAISSITSL